MALGYFKKNRMCLMIENSLLMENFFDGYYLGFLAWTILNKSNKAKKIFMKLKGNVTGQYITVPANTSVTFPEGNNYQFWDAETNIELRPKRQVIVNKDGFYE